VARPEEQRAPVPAPTRSFPLFWPVYRPLSTSGRDDRWLIPVGVITMVGVIAGVASEGLPPGVGGETMVGLLVVAAACWGVALSQRINDQRVVVLALAGLGICGALLDWEQNDGPGFVVGYLALAGLALRAPRRTALLAGAPIVVGIAAADAHDSANPVSTILAAVLSAGFLFVTSAVAAFSRDAHHRAEARLAREAAVREAREQMATLAERSRLARELHDVLAHSLTGLFLQLEAARLLAASTAADVRLAGHIGNAHRLAQGGMLSARRALEALRGDEVPGPANLPELISQMASTWGIPMTFGVEGVPRPLVPEAGLTVYRAVQEALTNAAKHAGRGARVSVTLSWEPDSLEVSVTDSGGDGVGAGLMSSGFGLTSMVQRAAAHGGSLDFGPTGAGFRVRLRLPVDPVPLPRLP
jgi:signal transduction histidine kinase